MKTKLHLLLLAPLMFAVTVSPLRAQIVADAATNTLINVTTNITGDVTVGTNGSFTLLVLSDNALLTNSANGIIGLTATAKSNEVRLISGSSRWLMGGSLTVGSNGAFNRFVISNGATVSSPSAAVAIIGQESDASNNAALVTGINSVWNSGFLRVGNFGSFNQLVVSNGATVFSTSGDIAFVSGANNNTVLVTGSNSVWDNANGTALRVGRSGSFNQLVVSNGGTVFNSFGTISTTLGASNNVAVVTGAGSVWSNRTDLRIGDSGAGNRVIVSDGAALFSATGDIGYSLNSGNNAVLVTGSNSLWRSLSGTALRVGRDGSFNQLVISNGATVLSSFVSVGTSVSASNNLTVVTGVGTYWSNRTELRVGDVSPDNRLLISDAGTVSAGSGVVLGTSPASTGNRITINGGSLVATNDGVTSVFDIRRGTNRLDAGWIDADQLVMTNAAGIFEFNGGTLSVRASTVSNGKLFRVGNGTNPATFNLGGNGLHDFTATPGVSLSSNAMLTGNGTLSGDLVVSSGGQLNPGGSVGKIILSNSPSLQGATTMEISKNGAALTNDQIQVTGTLTYGGSLIASNLGPTTLAIGDRFPLFSANSYTGAFSVVTLPLLPAGLNWANKLLVDGSIEVVATPQFTSVTLSGTNVIFSGTGGTSNAPYAVLTATNVALPLSNWVSIATNLFDSGGNFSFTNAIATGIPQRFYRIRTP